MRRSSLLTLLIAAPLGFVGACTQLPEVDERIPAHLKTADYPTLEPLHLLLPEEPPAAQASAELHDSLEARRARLQRRAAALRNQGVSEAERQRLKETVD